MLKNPPTRKGLRVSKGRTLAPRVVWERNEVFSTSGVFFFPRRRRGELAKKVRRRQLKERRSGKRTLSLPLSLPLPASIARFPRALTCNDHQTAHGDGERRHREVEADSVGQSGPRRQRTCRLGISIRNRRGGLRRGSDGHFRLGGGLEEAKSRSYTKAKGERGRSSR